MPLFVIDYSVSLPPANEVCEGYVFTPSVSHSVHRGGVCLNACWDTPPEQTPQGADTPPQEQTSPLSNACMPGDTGNKWAVRILLECILVHYVSSTITAKYWGEADDVNILQNLVSCSLPYPNDITEAQMLSRCYTRDETKNPCLQNHKGCII